MVVWIPDAVPRWPHLPSISPIIGVSWMASCNISSVLPHDGELNDVIKWLQAVMPGKRPYWAGMAAACDLTRRQQVHGNMADLFRDLKALLAQVIVLGNLASTVSFRSQKRFWWKFHTVDVGESAYITRQIVNTGKSRTYPAPLLPPHARCWHCCELVFISQTGRRSLRAWLEQTWISLMRNNVGFVSLKIVLLSQEYHLEIYPNERPIM